MALRVVFFGTPTFAVPTLEAIAQSSHQLVGVVTQPDRPRGRGHKVSPSPVKVAAERHGVPVLQPERLKDEAFAAAFNALGPDIAVVAAYGKLLPQALLDRPPLGMINVHASLLPRWRGAAPIHRAILAGDRTTGVTIMRVVLALDAGPMLAKVETTIAPDETSVALEARLAALGAPLAAVSLDRLAAGEVSEEPQNAALATYAARLERRDSVIDWTRSAQAVHDQIRGLQPWPLAAVRVGGARLRLLASETSGVAVSGSPGTIGAVGPAGLLVATGDGTLLVTRVQPDGRPAMAVRDFINGHAIVAGSRFEAPLDL